MKSHPSPLRTDAVRALIPHEDFDALLEQLDAPEDTWVALIVDAERATEIERRISHARARSTESRVLMFESNLSPLGIQVLTEIAQSTQTELDPGALLELLHRVSGAIRCFAVLESVARLTQAQPSLMQHALSLLPSSRFIAEAHGRVLRGTRAEDFSAIQPSESASVAFTVEGDRQATEAITDALLARLQPVTVVPRNRPAGAGSRWWGLEHPTEVCLAPADLAPHITTVREQSTACDWCGFSRIAPVCRVCHRLAPDDQE
ncbi:hypothetical protein NLM24_46895 [Nocardia zapadnayensis]|uniref:hypothetical protein n=1 Tax=Brevibacterium sp. NPDC049920 TaxID=3155279 RepID=UPI0022471C83|nr:hypothetical protein [Nocardia zapadnayensis]MCX0277958.1 hypothetical protein [Nocardia zapadnayensis]